MIKAQSNIKDKNINTPRHASRIAAVQALYQIAQTSTDCQKVVHQMILSSFDTIKQEGYVAPDKEFFEQLVVESSAQFAALDEEIQPHLSDNWRIERLASVLLMILRLGIFELKSCLTIPKTVVINEYIEITKAFFPGGNETRFVNSVLDKAAKLIR
ncbi:MAG: transcription antitermination factor NusB, partial [Alphaproteobacteria bacterium]|nr:transcription antitermination factor NusB [Alphaproteobacteria bacterium]